MSVTTLNFPANKAEGKPGPPSGETPAGGEFQVLHEGTVALSPGLDERYGVNAIFTFYQIGIAELERITNQQKNTGSETYSSEARAVKAEEGKPEVANQKLSKPQTFSTPWQKTTEEGPGYKRVGAEIKSENTIRVEQGILPVNVVVVTELMLASGVRWSVSQETTVHYTNTEWNKEAEKFAGLVTLANYADLVNPIYVESGEALKARVRVSVGLPVKCKVFGGVTFPSPVTELPQADSITLWYGYAPAPQTTRGGY